MTPWEDLRNLVGRALENPLEVLFHPSTVGAVLLAAMLGVGLLWVRKRSKKGGRTRRTRERTVPGPHHMTLRPRETITSPRRD